MELKQSAGNKTRNEIIALIVLGLLLAGVLYMNRGRAVRFVGIQTDTGKFKPIGVEDPTLRLDLLQRLRQLNYTGEHRNIFSAQPLPPPASVAQHPAPVVNPMPSAPAGPPPLMIPATLFGIVVDHATGQRKACFSGSEEDVFIVPQGGTLLGQYRITRIGTNSVDIQEISTGRSTTLTLAPPVNSQAQ